MPRILAILKWVPAVVCGLLVVAWVVSVVHRCEVTWVSSNSRHWVFVSDATLAYYFDEAGSDTGLYVGHCETTNVNIFGFLGISRYVNADDLDDINFALPFPGVLTLLLPVAVGPFTRFRFPLWSYFAWTALIAAELAYYLR